MVRKNNIESKHIHHTQLNYFSIDGDQNSDSDTTDMGHIKSEPVGYLL